MTEQKTKFRITFLVLDSEFGAECVSRTRTKFSTTFRTCGTKFSTSIERYPIPIEITYRDNVRLLCLLRGT